MKFKCGPSQSEKGWAKVRRLTTWHPFFPLLPRRVAAGDCRWLETIHRKGTICPHVDGAYWEWEYKA